MLERAVAAGVAPMLATLIERGRYIPDCVAAFPSVTPVCAASIVTGAAQDEHLIPGMNWFHRDEHRYVEYGSSFRAAQRFGIVRQLTDTVYNMNRAHLSPDTPTVFESLDDVNLRTAGTTYLMYRGRHRHEPQKDTALDALRLAPDAPPGDGPARAVLRRHLRLAADRLPLGPRHAGRARPPHRLRRQLPGRARPVRLPAAVAARQRLVLAQARPRRPAALDRPGRPAARPRVQRRRRDRSVPARSTP